MTKSPLMRYYSTNGDFDQVVKSITLLGTTHLNVCLFVFQHLGIVASLVLLVYLCRVFCVDYHTNNILGFRSPWHDALLIDAVV